YRAAVAEGADRGQRHPGANRSGRAAPIGQAVMLNAPRGRTSGRGPFAAGGRAAASEQPYCEQAERRRHGELPTKQATRAAVAVHGESLLEHVSAKVRARRRRSLRKSCSRVSVPHSSAAKSKIVPPFRHRAPKQ